MIRPIATALGDLTSSEWHLVADRVRYGDTDHWAWHLSDTDKDALLLERDIGGTIATAHEKLPGGVVRLLARRLKVKGASGMAAERARIAQEGPAEFGRRPPLDATEKPQAARFRPFQRPAQRWAEAERRVGARIGAERVLTGEATGKGGQ